MKTEEKTIREYIEALSSKSPVPGGGGASALAGAYGVSLGLMVSELTIGKKKYADFEESCKKIAGKLVAIRESFIELSDEDEKVFLPLSKAYSLPKDTEEEKLYRSEVLEHCLTEATLTPIKVMEKANEALNYMEELAHSGSRLAVSDIGVGTQYLITAINGAVMNVYINASMLEKVEKGAELVDYATKLKSEGTSRAGRIYEYVETELKPCYTFDTRQRHDKVDFGG